MYISKNASGYCVEMHQDIV